MKKRFYTLLALFVLMTGAAFAEEAIETSPAAAPAEEVSLAPAEAAVQEPSPFVDQADLSQTCQAVSLAPLGFLAENAFSLRGPCEDACSAHQTACRNACPPPIVDPWCYRDCFCENCYCLKECGSMQGCSSFPGC